MMEHDPTSPVDRLLKITSEVMAGHASDSRRFGRDCEEGHSRGRSQSADRVSFSGTPSLRPSVTDSTPMPSLSISEAFAAPAGDAGTDSNSDDSSDVSRSLSRKAVKLLEMTGDTEAQRISAYVLGVLHDPTSDVGRIRHRFLREDVRAALRLDNPLYCPACCCLIVRCWCRCVQFPAQLVAKGIAPKSVGMKAPPSSIVASIDAPTGATQRFIDDLFVHIMETRKSTLNTLRVDLPMYPPDDVRSLARLVFEM
jgi:hypothetical protein